jgi:hypothetical protein
VALTNTIEKLRMPTAARTRTRVSRWFMATLYLKGSDLSAVADSATPDGRCPARAPSCWNSAKSRSPPASDALRADLLE